MTDEDALGLVRKIMLGAFIAFMFPIFFIILIGSVSPGLLSPDPFEHYLLRSLSSVSVNYSTLHSTVSELAARAYLVGCTQVFVVHLSALIIACTGILLVCKKFQSKNLEPTSSLAIHSVPAFLRQADILRRSGFALLTCLISSAALYFGFLPLSTDVAASRPNRFIVGALFEFWLPLLMVSTVILLLWAGLVVDFFLPRKRDSKS